MAESKEKVAGVLGTVLKGLDEQIAEYLSSVLEEDPLQKVRMQGGKDLLSSIILSSLWYEHARQKTWRLAWDPSC